MGVVGPTKRHKTVDQSLFENPLLPLADHDDEKKDVDRFFSNGGTAENSGRNNHDEDDDEGGKLGQKKRNRTVKVRKDTVNRQNLELKDYIRLPAPSGTERLQSKYDLIANIVHNGEPGEGSYRVFVQRKSEELWYEMQDLHISETLPQMVALSEAYIQIYEQQQ